MEIVIGLVVSHIFLGIGALCFLYLIKGKN